MTTHTRIIDRATMVRLKNENAELKADNAKLKAWMKTKKGAITAHVRKEQELLDLLEGVLHQACGEGNTDKIDTMGLSAYEDAAQFLKRIGRLKYNGRIGKWL